jgi:predicted site-specific integrase-resolvase
MKKKTHTVRTPNLKTTDHCLLSRKEVAKMLSLSVPTVKRYQQQGLIKPIIVNSRVVRYRHEEILEFIEQAAA